MEKVVIESCSGPDLRQYMFNSRDIIHSKGAVVLQPRTGLVVFKFAKKEATECIIKFRRESGNGVVSIFCNGKTSNYQINSKTGQDLTFNLRGDKMIHIHRTARSRGSIEILSVSLCAMKETYMDWNSILKKCNEYACLRLVGNDLLVSEGGFIKGANIHVRTDPPDMCKYEGDTVRFLGSCKIISLDITGSRGERVQSKLEKKILDSHTKLEAYHEENLPNKQEEIPVQAAAARPTFSVVNSWYLTKIPNIVHFYWGGYKLPFLRYVSMYSFIKQNPGWKAKLHVPTSLGASSPTWKTNEQRALVSTSVSHDYFDKIKELPIEIVKHDFEKYSFKNEAHEVHKSDLLRWILLSSEGGIWSDNDIIYTHPMIFMSDNKKENAVCDTGICQYNGGAHAIGFLMSSPGNAFYRSLSVLAKRNFRKNKYQSLGADILNKKFNVIKKSSGDCKFLNIAPDTVYPIRTEPIFTKSKIFIQDYEQSIGFHWYGGHPATSAIEAQLNYENYREYNHFISKLVRFVLEG